MKRFLVELLRFCAVQFAFLFTFVGLYYGVNFEYDPMAAILDKERLLKETPGPRIIVLGDSGVPFGTVSPMLKEAFPERNPINTGLAAGFGHRILLGEVEPEVREGDVVVVCFVYELFIRNLLNAFVYPLSAQDPDVFLSLDYRDYPTITRTAFIMIKSAMRHTRSLWFSPLDKPFIQPYARDSYNEYGDIDAHYTMPPPEGRPLSLAELEFDDFDYAREMIADLNQFAAACEAKGATVYFLFPGVSEQSYADHGHKMEQLADLMAEELEFQMLNRPGDSVYPESFFYDTPYHLTGEGARARTARLIEALQNHLE